MSTGQRRRDGFDVGREVRSLTVRAGAEPYVHVRKNLSMDDDAGVYVVWTETHEGDRTSEPEPVGFDDPAPGRLTGRAVVVP